MNARRLSELDPEWVFEDNALPESRFFVVPGDGRTKVGLWFDCPICPSGHKIPVAFAENRIFPKPVWRVENPDDFEKITIHPSINCQPSCPFHGWIRNGEVTW